MASRRSFCYPDARVAPPEEFLRAVSMPAPECFKAAGFRLPRAMRSAGGAMPISRRFYRAPARRYVICLSIYRAPHLLRRTQVQAEILGDDAIADERDGRKISRRFSYCRRLQFPAAAATLTLGMGPPYLHAREHAISPHAAMRR